MLDDKACPNCDKGVTLSVAGWLGGLRVIFTSCNSCDYIFFRGF